MKRGQRRPFHLHTWPVCLLAELLDLDQETIVHAANRPKYHRVVVPKNEEGTKFRVFNIPQGRTRLVQEAIFERLLPRMEVSESAYAYVSGRGVHSCVAKHLMSDSFLYIDFADAFGNVTTEMLEQTLIRELEASGLAQEARESQESREWIRKADEDLTEKIAKVLVALVQLPRGGLPQGAPTSPYLLNLAAKALDKELETYCDRAQLTYTRYSDDLVISGMGDIPENTRRRLRNIVKRHGFVINWDKSHYKRGRATEPRIMGVVLKGGEGQGLFSMRETVLPKRKVEEYRSLIHHAMTDPEIPVARIKGVMDWCLSVYGGRLPNRLKKPLRAYFRRHDPVIAGKYHKYLSA